MPLEMLRIHNINSETIGQIYIKALYLVMLISNAMDILSKRMHRRFFNAIYTTRVANISQHSRIALGSRARTTKDFKRFLQMVTCKVCFLHIQYTVTKNLVQKAFQIFLIENAICDIATSYKELPSSPFSLPSSSPPSPPPTLF